MGEEGRKKRGKEGGRGEGTFLEHLRAKHWFLLKSRGQKAGS